MVNDLVIVSRENCSEFSEQRLFESLADCIRLFLACETCSGFQSLFTLACMQSAVSVEVLIQFDS